MIILKEIKISENVFNALSMRASANALTIEEQVEHDLRRTVATLQTSERRSRMIDPVSK